MIDTIETKPNELQVVVQESGIEPQKQNKIVEALGQFFNKVPEWEQMISGIIITDPSEVGKMKMAREARLSLQKTRTAAKKFVEDKRDEVKARMANDVLEDKLWLKLFQIMEATFKNLEGKAEEKEKFAERWEAQNKERLRAERTALLSPYVEDVTIYPLGDFNEESFKNLLAGQKLAHEAKIEAHRKAEEERIAKEKAEEEEEKRIEQQRKEKEQADKKAKRAPDKQKLTDLSTAIKLIAIPECKSEEGKAIIENTKGLIDKLTKYIEDNADKL